MGKLISLIPIMQYGIVRKKYNFEMKCEFRGKRTLGMGELFEE